MIPHPRISPRNYPILKLSEEHPARRALQVHAEACDMCVGKEIAWADKPWIKPIEQEWYSETDQKVWWFSSLAYMYLSYELEMHGWLNLSPEPLGIELKFLFEEAPKLRVLLSECEAASRAEGNDRILPLIEKTREFVDAYEEAILFRFEQQGIELDHLD